MYWWPTECFLLLSLRIVSSGYANSGPITGPEMPESQGRCHQPHGLIRDGLQYDDEADEAGKENRAAKGVKNQLGLNRWIGELGLGSEDKSRGSYGLDYGVEEKGRL